MSALSVSVANMESESVLLAKLIYRNYNQHRSTKVFSILHKVRLTDFPRVLQLVSSYLVRVESCSFLISSHCSTSRPASLHKWSCRRIFSTWILKQSNTFGWCKSKHKIERLFFRQISHGIRKSFLSTFLMFCRFFLHRNQSKGLLPGPLVIAPLFWAVAERSDGDSWGGFLVQQGCEVPSLDVGNINVSSWLTCATCMIVPLHISFNNPLKEFLINRVKTLLATSHWPSLLSWSHLFSSLLFCVLLLTAEHWSHCCSRFYSFLCTQCSSAYLLEVFSRFLLY